jgi:hypothetical protein
MISAEVKMIQRDHPSPTFSEPDSNTLRPAGARKTVDSEAVGEKVAPGRMGENDTPTQEGPLAQGVGRVIDAEKDVQDTSEMARGARSPHDAVEEPVEGGSAVLDVASGSRPAEEDKARELIVKQDVKASKQTPKQPVTEVAPSTSSSTMFLKDLASGKYNTSTIAGGRFESVIADHVSQATRQATPKRRTRRDPTPPDILRKVVSGKYDTKHFLSGEVLEQPALNEIARATSMNGTYMPEDTGHFLHKVRSLLPAAPTERARQRAGKETGKDA